MSLSHHHIEHVRFTSDRSFEEYTAALEKQLGQIEPDALKNLVEGGPPEVARKTLEAMLGSSAFMVFGKIDHGALLRLVGRPRKAVQYVVGNPLYAVQLTQHAIGTGLYAPLRILIYETDDGKTCVEYDRPSSLFGQFGDEQVDRMASFLDRKFEELLALSAR